MSDFIAIGTTLFTTDKTPFIVTALNENKGKTQIYSISIGGEDRVFTRIVDCSDEKKAFYENLASEKIALTEINWPVAFCNNPAENIFGFISKAQPKDYTTISDLLYERTNPSSIKAEIDICLNLATVLGKLSEKGYYIANFTESDIAFNISSGTVFLNVFSNITNEKTMHSASMNAIKFIPPEYNHQNGKNILVESTRYILSCLMFIVLFRAHPFEGAKASSKAYLTNDDLRELYLKKPVFMLDPDDDSNRPSEYIYSKLQEKWNAFPDFVKELFIKSFSKDAIKNPLSRPDELNWITSLSKMRSFSFTCTCTNLLTLSEDGKGACQFCNKTIEIPCRIKLKDYTIPAVNKTRIYRCQVTDDYTISNATEPVGVIVANPSNPQLLGFKNMTSETLICTTAEGNKKPISNGDIAPLINGISTVIYGTTIYFINSLSAPTQPVQKTVVEPVIEPVVIQEEEFVFNSEPEQDSPTETSSEPESETAEETVETVEAVEAEDETQSEQPPQSLFDEILSSSKENLGELNNKPIKPNNTPVFKEKSEGADKEPLVTPSTETTETESTDDSENE